jgi:hypothetical protein
LVFRHRPWEPGLNKVFDWIVAERRDLFDCYQSTHGANTEAALARASHVASFVRYKPKKALYVGLYRVDAMRTLSVEEYQNRPLHRELMHLGMGGHKASDGRTSVREFSMTDTGWNADWSRRLVIDWPGLERSWYRWADRNQFGVNAITEEPLLIAAMPDWQELTLDWSQLALLPTAWQAALAQWRGVYLIIDQSDGKQYVGSAYGRENILQRWLGYARTGHGGNKLLKNRDPNDFVFSILQRVSPDLPDSDVIELERSWKSRLRSGAPFGLNEN